MTYFYGKLNIEEKLKFLDEEYFSKYEKSDNEIVIIPQKPYIDLNYQQDYEIGENEEVKDNTYMSLCYGLDHYKNYEEYLAMNILAEALLSKNDSPLKKIAPIPINSVITIINNPSPPILITSNNTSTDNMAIR